jgi:hypothetical protein
MGRILVSRHDLVAVWLKHIVRSAKRSSLMCNNNFWKIRFIDGLRGVSSRS